MTAPAAAAGDGPALRLRKLGKRYGSHVALSDVDLDLAPGRVHVLFGENGAGKSTLISMLAGASVPSSGTIEVGAHRGAFASVAEARAHGVRAVFQEFSLIPQLTVAENITLGEEPTGRLGLLSKSAALAEAQRVVERLGFDLRPEAKVDHLARGKQQMVEICKAAREAPRVLILDEPTASLSEHDAQALFALVRRLKAEGTAIVYITHRLHEITQIGDEVTVLRDGRQVGTVPANTSENRLVELMTVGVDMGARRAIYDYLAELAAAGAAILLVSSDLPELMGLSHRLLVMRGGRLVAEFDRAHLDESRILEQFFE